jgi:hypothetical protein
LPDQARTGALEPAGDGLWRCPVPEAEERTYRLCQNYHSQNVCNWAVPADDPKPLCRSCRLTRVIPDLSRPGHPEAWYKLEVAKRRLVYSLANLKLPLANKFDDPERGLAFEFLADPEDPAAPRVLTTTTASSSSTSPRPTTPSASGGDCRCTNPTAPCWATSATRSAIITGTG